MLAFRRSLNFLVGISRHDFFPDFSQRFRRFLGQPLGVLLSSLVVAVLCGLVLHPRVFALAGGIGLILVLGICWPWLTIAGIRSNASFDRLRAQEGETAGVSSRTQNALPWPVWNLILREGDSVLRLASFSGRSVLTSAWEFPCSVRGEHPLQPLRLETSFPFGVWTARREVPVSRPLLVWPRTFPVGPVPTASETEGLDGKFVRNRPGSSGEVVGVRPYRRGDSPRRIHWIQSARQDRLITCEVQSLAQPTILIVLDLEDAVHTPGRDGTREWAIRIAASLARGWTQAGARVGASWQGVWLPPNAGVAQGDRILDELARIQGTVIGTVRDVLAECGKQNLSGVVPVVIGTDGSLATSQQQSVRNGNRWVVLNRRGFHGDSIPARRPTCDEAPPRPAAPAWLDIPDVASVPYKLRHGWAEARHGG